MAVIIATELESGLIIPESYARIDTVSGYKGGITISLNYYINQQAFMDDKGYLKQELYTFIPSVEDGSPNFIKQGYEYVKTLLEFENAIDV